MRKAVLDHANGASSPTFGVTQEVQKFLSTLENWYISFLLSDLESETSDLSDPVQPPEFTKVYREMYLLFKIHSNGTLYS